MAEQEQMRKLFQTLCEEIPHEDLSKIGIPLMIGGTLPSDVSVPSKLEPYFKNGVCHLALKDAIIDVTITRTQKEKENETHES